MIDQVGKYFTNFGQTFVHICLAKRSLYKKQWKRNDCLHSSLVLLFQLYYFFNTGRRIHLEKNNELLQIWQLVSFKKCIKNVSSVQITMHQLSSSHIVANPHQSSFAFSMNIVFCTIYLHSLSHLSSFLR